MTGTKCNLAARLLWEQEVLGSNPRVPTTLNTETEMSDDDRKNISCGGGAHD